MEYSGQRINGGTGSNCVTTEIMFVLVLSLEAGIILNLK